MRVILYDGECPTTREIHFARLPGPERTIIVVFKDKHGVQRAIKSTEIMEIVDA